MNFSENLVKYRKMKSYTQDDLAEYMGVSRQSVSKWENGDSVPEISKIVKIADYLEVSMDALFGRDEVVKTEQNISSKQDVSIDLKPNLLRTIIFSVVILFLGLAIGFGIGFGVSGNRNSEKIDLDIDNIQVSSFSFSPIIENRGGMNLEFVLSKYSDEIDYSIIANADESYYDRKGNVKFENGVCKSTINTTSGVRYNIVLQISFKDEVRYITLAEKVWGDGSGQNIPSDN